MNTPLKVPKYTRREILIGICVGLIVLLAAGYGVVKVWENINSTMLSGLIVAKHEITPPQEHRISYSKGSLNLQQVESKYYVFEVDVQGEIYFVKVNETIFNRHQKGAAFRFPAPIEGVEGSADLRQLLDTPRED